MKKLYALVLLICTAAMLAGCLTGCGSSTQTAKAEGHQLYLRDFYKRDSRTATFKSITSDEEETFEMELVGENDDYTTFTTYADTSKYDRVIFSKDSEIDETIELAFNDYVDGYHITASGVLPFVYDNEEKDITYKTVPLKYDENNDKNIYIRTPDDYDADDKDTKYSVIYMTDGQNLFDKSATTHGCWSVAECVESMMSQSDNRAIIVGIDDSTGNRSSELTPVIGEVLSDNELVKNGTGEYFSDFVYETVVPYIESSYNVYTDSKHNSICGSSSGGIESFYIGMEHPDKFGTIGAFSPAFSYFGEDSWINYLNGLEFEDNQPFVYIYSGNGDELEQWLYYDAANMQTLLENAGYPKDKVVFAGYDKGVHNEKYWRAVFPEFLKYAFSE